MAQIPFEIGGEELPLEITDMNILGQIYALKELKEAVGKLTAQLKVGK